MKRVFPLFLFGWMLLAFSCQPQTETYRLLEAIEAHDTAVHLLGDTWMRDPYIYLADDGFYYLTCTRQNNLLPNNEMAINFWRSTDLVNWEDLGARFTRGQSNWMEELYAIDSGYGAKEPMIWAPEMYQHDGKWVVVHCSNKQRANLMKTEGAELAGPWIEPLMQNFGHRHDPSVFTDDDGSHYLVYACAQLQKFNPGFEGYAGDPVSIGPSNRKLGHEGCMIHKMGDNYVLFGTAWTRDQLRHGSYNLYYCVADKVDGPYGPRQFAGRFLGHGTLFKDKQDRWWCTAFLNGDYTAPDVVKAGGIAHDKATTINKQGLTLVPVVFKQVDGEIVFYAKDENYRYPGDDEMQQFDMEKLRSIK